MSTGSGWLAPSHRLAAGGQGEAHQVDDPRWCVELGANGLPRFRILPQQSDEPSPCPQHPTQAHSLDAAHHLATHPDRACDERPFFDPRRVP